MLQRRSSFRNQFLIAIFISIGALVSFFFAHQYLNNDLHNTVELARLLDDQTTSILNLKSSLNLIKSQIDSMVASEDHELNHSIIQRHFQEIDSTTSRMRPDSILSLQEIKKLVETLRQLLDSNHRTRSEKQLQFLKSSFDQFQFEIEELLNHDLILLRERLTRAYLRIKEERERSKNLSLLIVVSLSLLLVFAFRRVYGRLQMFLINMSHYANQTRRNGLGEKLKITNEDELGDVERDFNSMISSLEISQNELRRSNQDLEKFAQMASHDLQTPLRYISAYTQLITNERASLSEQQLSDFSENISKSVQRLTTLIRNLLEFSKVGYDLPARELTTLDRTLDPILSERSHVPFSITTEGSSIEFFAYPSLMQTLFQNLIDNSIKYSDKTTIQIRIAVLQGGENFEIHYSDNGPGIPLAEHNRIFDLFRRGTQSSNSEGYGVGLAVCQKIMSFHQGTISIEAVSTGVCFRLLGKKTPT